MRVYLKYYKESGKYYSDGEYETSIEPLHDWLVFGEIRSFQETGILPGLSSGKWDGYILARIEEGTSAILDFTKEKNEILK